MAAVATGGETDGQLCPTCKKGLARRGQPGFPFCSERCRLVDLQGWLDERYRIPVAAGSDDDADDETMTRPSAHRTDAERNGDR